MSSYRTHALVLFIAGCSPSSAPLVPVVIPPVVPPVIKCDMTVSWTPPTERIDGVPLPIDEIQNYTIYIEDVRETKVPGDLTSWEMRDLPEGRLVINMTATDTINQESERSETIVRVCG